MLAFLSVEHLWTLEQLLEKDSSSFKNPESIKSKRR